MKGEKAYRMLVGRKLNYSSLSGPAYIYGSDTHPNKGSVLAILNQQAEYIKELEWRIRTLEHADVEMDEYNEKMLKYNNELEDESDG